MRNTKSPLGFMNLIICFFTDVGVRTKPSPVSSAKAIVMANSDIISGRSIKTYRLSIRDRPYFV